MTEFQWFGAGLVRDLRTWPRVRLCKTCLVDRLACTFGLLAKHGSKRRRI
ncbi:hypothetical protein MPH_10776 [Macrophomina phaseolina MS6]|uniref:Uncharacterized protein n=1 Tax=Macrophomina phaseolina (strain MS6) TaxID=1126212 RepID=K2S621_MACPH|nr:hypothetical protein MPH_10776 [Macrophomina phaseolina MS6]